MELRSSLIGEKSQKSQKPNHTNKRNRANYRISTYTSLYGSIKKIWQILNYRKSDFWHFVEYDMPWYLDHI
jgi:hypothetical protein